MPALSRRPQALRSGAIAAETREKPMILVLFIAGGALALAVLACVAIDSPVPLGDAAAALVGVPFASLDPSSSVSEGAIAGIALAEARRRSNTVIDDRLPCPADRLLHGAGA